MTLAQTDPAARLAAAARRLAGGRRAVPASTYRLQMHAGFTFRDAERIVPYVASLGVSHLYLSPILAARPGSLHGYDVVDPTRLNPEVGTEDEFRSLVSTARAAGLGVVLDVVPNHMAVGPANPWWRDVFEHGPSSPYAGYFDIAWDDPPRPDLRGRVTLPILGAPYFQVLEGGELKLAFTGGAVVVVCYGQAFPVDPRTYDRVLKPALELLSQTPDAPADAPTELQSILTAVRHLAPRTEPDPERVKETRAEAEVVKRRLATLADAHPAAADALKRAVESFHCSAGLPDGCCRLDELLEAQAYRLCFWRVASDEINYRRFFDVNELSALAAEREDVFRDTHALVLRLAGEGLIDGLRIDHPDGLFDPKQYLERLQQGYLVACAKHLADTDPEFRDTPWAEVEPAVRELLAGPSADGPALYVVVEKILERTELLPPDWVAAGATGYEFLNPVAGLFVDPAAEAPLTRTYEGFTGRDDPFPEIVFQKKMLVLSSSFSSELDMLARQLDRLARRTRQARDFTLNGLRRALRAVIACFPVYRSYLADGVSPVEDRLVRRAVRDARRRAPTLSPDLFEFIRETLLQKPAPGVDESYAVDQRRFAGKFEQVTAPVTAKGVEDTAFYVFDRMAALNEVGGDPARFGWPPADVHKFLTDRQARHPGALNAGSTHDTKRGEDVRARLAALSEVPSEWADRVTKWADANRRHRVSLEDGGVALDPNDEYLLYQTLVGAWPPDADDPGGLAAFADRVKAFMGKATHEAKVHTSWINPDPEYDAAVPEFVGRVLDPAKSAPFLDDLKSFAAATARVGVVNGLAQAVVRCAAPGVPDTYQGTELWDLNLVDPDNRRPVDYARRAAFLRDLDERANDAAGLVRELLAAPGDGRAKLHVTSRLLRFRRDHRDLFARGQYLPLTATGPHADNVFAFARRHEGQVVVAVVPRLTSKLTGGAELWPVGRDVWADTRLGPLAGTWSNLFTSEQVGGGDGTDLAVADLFGPFPVAVLVRA